jgi:hypothetical protein
LGSIIINSITSATTLGNSGTLTLGNAGDSTTFTGGLVATAPSGITTGGTIATTDTTLTLGDAGTAITLGAATILSAGSGAINLNGATNGANTLALNTTGTSTIGAIIGGSTPITSLTTNAGGTTAISADVTTSGAQTYGDAVTLTQDVVLTAGGDITFSSTISGRYNLNLDVGDDGNILFSNNVGVYADPIGAMTILNANNVTLSSDSGIYVTSFTQSAGSGTTDFAGLLYAGLGNSFWFIHGDGPATIKTDTAQGDIDVGTLVLGVRSAVDLEGYVGGESGMDALDYIRLLHRIGVHTHFFNEFNLYDFPNTIMINEDRERKEKKQRDLKTSILAESFASDSSAGTGYMTLLADNPGC